MSLGHFGWSELKQSEHIKIIRILRNVHIILFSIFFILILTKTLNTYAIVTILYVIWALIVAPLPIAFYLNRKQNRLSAESTVADAN